MGERREGVQVLEVAAIEPDLRGPRQTFGDEPLAELANSIRQHGVLQPLVVHAPVDEATARMLPSSRTCRGRTSVMLRSPSLNPQV